MRRLAIPAMSILALAACDPEVPDSGAGVGFGSYNNYQQDQAQTRAQREAQLTNATTVRPPEVTGAPTATGAGAPAAGLSSADLAAAGIGTTATAGATAGGAVITSAPGAPLSATAAGAAYAGGNSAGISDEQSFAAVSSRETIQSDAERLARQQAQYQPVPAQSVPSRPSNTGPDIVAYALATNNPVGRQAYMRTLPSQSKAQRKCAKYASPDLAQRAFLETGGPEKDRHGIDPDGDGYACSWNPDPFRRAVSR